MRLICGSLGDLSLCCRNYTTFFFTGQLMVTYTVYIRAVLSFVCTALLIHRCQSCFLLSSLLHFQCLSNAVLPSTVMTSYGHWFLSPFNRNDASRTPRWTDSLVHEISTLCLKLWLVVDTLALGQRSLPRIHLIFCPVTTEAFCIRKLNHKMSCE